MPIKSPWPWITLLLAAALALNPVGFDIIRTAFFSNEALSRNIGQPIVLIGGAIVCLIGLVEWLIRLRILRRRPRRSDHR